MRWHGLKTTNPSSLSTYTAWNIAVGSNPSPIFATGDTAKARGAYQDFLSLWKDGDPDIPILREAKSEYATLK